MSTSAPAPSDVKPEEDMPFPIESKSMQCQHCYKEQGPDAPVLLCSLCRKTRYCDVVCQRANWKIHKRNCLGRRTDLQAPIPSLRFTFQDLSEFVATHRVDIINASLNALESYEPFPTYDESEYGLVVHVHYESTRQDTPEKRFSLEDAHVMSFKEMDKLSSKGMMAEKQGSDMRRAREKRLVEAKKRYPYLRSFVCLIMCHPYSLILPGDCYPNAIDAFARSPMPDWKKWLAEQFS